MKIQIRPSADKTRLIILKAAKKLFLKEGFNGTTTDKIAKAAKVNSNLIFHHFHNKETLWKKVKESIVAYKNISNHYDLSSAKSFFRSILDYRFAIYDNNPDFVRLIQWQQLTENESELLTENYGSPNEWLKPIKNFQKKDEILKSIDAQQIMLFIVFSSHAPFMQTIVPMTEEQKLNYKNMIFEMCCQKFLNKRSEKC